MIKTFRGILADGGQDRIRLSTIKGKVGYQVTKFQIISKAPFTNNDEHIVKLYKVEQSSIDGVVDFTDSDIMGVAIINNASAGYTAPSIPVIIFDRDIFNQDMYITHFSDSGSDPCNYYLELEVIPLDERAAEYTTLKDLRAGTSTF